MFTITAHEDYNLTFRVHSQEVTVPTVASVIRVAGNMAASTYWHFIEVKNENGMLIALWDYNLGWQEVD